jgi:hypothetical protein
MKQRQPATKQPTPAELLDELLDFVQRKFYQGHALAFTKDRPRLLKWVVLWPATWLNKRGVTLPPSRYREIFMSVFLDGIRFGTADQITYFPAYLAKIIQSHFEHHGDEIYAEAKSIRNLVENAVVVAGRSAQAASDPVRELASAATLLRAKKKPSKPAPKSQLNLL